MQWENARLAFPKSSQYAFLFENAHLLLLAFERDDAKFLFLIKEHDAQGLVVDYPGATFTNRVMDTIENIFFVQVDEQGSDTKKYILGSYFTVGQAAYAAYYEKDSESPDVVLFSVEGEAPDLQLEVLEGDEYERVAKAFMEQHEDIVNIQHVNRNL